jgi:type I restriction enzyme S subunit
MIIKQLEDVIDFARNGASIKQSDGQGGYPITRIETIWNKTIDQDRFGFADISDDELVNYEKYLLESGDILMTHINSPKHLGKCAMYEGTPSKLIHGMNLICIRARTDESYPRYLKYYLNSKDFKNQLPKISNQSVNQASFSASKLKKLKIPIPPLDQQKKIAAILDAADAYRQKTKALIEKYDELTQSLFLEMFGDPVTNPKGWEQKKLVEVTSKIGSGATPRGGKEAYKEKGISLIRSMNVYDNKFKYENLAFIDKQQAERLKNVIVEEGDVLFNITGASICRSTVVPNEILPARVNQHVSILRPIQSMITSTFLSRFLISENVKIKLLGVGLGGGAVMEAITKEQLQNFNVIVPDLDLQSQFTRSVQAIETQRIQAQTSLSKAEDLFNSLLQRAFKGELV